MVLSIYNYAKVKSLALHFKHFTVLNFMIMRGKYRFTLYLVVKDGDIKFAVIIYR